jgi:hypothetical protein
MLCGDNDEVRTGLICVPICNYTLTLSFDIICLLLYYVQMVKPQMRGNQMGVWGVVLALVDMQQSTTQAEDDGRRGCRCSECADS